MTTRTATANASAVSRALRRAGFCPSQPTRSDRFPPLRVSRLGDSARVCIRRHRVRYSVEDVEAAIIAAGYVVEARYDYSTWTILYVGR